MPVLKSISLKSGVGNLIRYIAKEKKATKTLYNRLVRHIEHNRELGKATYVAGIKLSKKDELHLLREAADKSLSKALREFKGTIEEFVAMQIGQRDAVGHSKVVRHSDAALILSHNLKSATLDGIIKEFERVNDQRLYKRADQNVAIHTILSWHANDTAALSDERLRQIAKQYVALRGEGNVYLITKHCEKSHVHLHIAMPATGLDGRSNRQSKAEFQMLKLGLEGYIKTQFPELTSAPEHGKGSKNRYKNDDRLSVKNKAVCSIERILSSAKSKEDFAARLEADGFQVYSRGGKITGIQAISTGLKFRFSRLHVDVRAQLDQMTKSKQEKQLADLKSLRAGATRSMQHGATVKGEEKTNESESSQKGQTANSADSKEAVSDKETAGNEAEQKAEITNSSLDTLQGLRDEAAARQDSAREQGR